MARRDKGTGSVFYIDATKTWVAEVNWTDKKGKRCTKRFTSKKKNGKLIVKDNMQKFQRQLLVQSESVSASDVTFKEYAEYWRLNVYAGSVKDSSFAAKTRTLNHQVYPAIGDIAINSIETADIQKMIGDLTNEGYSYSIIKKAYEATNAVIRYYRSITKTIYDPCEHVVLPAAKERPKSDIRFFNEEERDKIIAECFRCYKNGARVYKYGEAIVIMMYTGMRIGEFLALEWDDINFEKRTIRVSKSVGTISIQKDGETRYTATLSDTPKTDKSNRVLPMSDIVCKCFLSLQKTFGKYKYVIATTSGNYVYPGHLNERFHNMLKRIGLYIESGDSQKRECNNGIHTLRHTFASMLFNNGCSVKVVSELLGHSSTKITEDTYIHIINEVKASAITDIDIYGTSLPTLTNLI